MNDDKYAEMTAKFIGLVNLHLVDKIKGVCDEDWWWENDHGAYCYLTLELRNPGRYDRRVTCAGSEWYAVSESSGAMYEIPEQIDDFIQELHWLANNFIESHSVV